MFEGEALKQHLHSSDGPDVPLAQWPSLLAAAEQDCCLPGEKHIIEELFQATGNTSLPPKYSAYRKLEVLQAQPRQNLGDKSKSLGFLGRESTVLHYLL